MMSFIVSFCQGLSPKLISTLCHARKLKFIEVHFPSPLQTIYAQSTISLAIINTWELKDITHEIKPTQKNESELGDIYVQFLYGSISFYRQHLKVAYVGTVRSCRYITWHTSTNSKN